MSGHYKSYLFNKSYYVETDQRVRWPCIRCKAWLLERFEEPYRCSCGYVGMDVGKDED